MPTSVTELALSPAGIKDNSTWIRGDLHIHSIYSDGDQNLYSIRDHTPNMRGRGYHLVYMSDHVGADTTRYLQRSACLCPVGPGMPPPCNATSTWQCYVTNTQRVSLPEIAFFPGAEINTRPDTWLGTAFTPEALSDAVNGRGVLSVRTGSDFHYWWQGFAQFYTHVLIPSSWSAWSSAPWSARQQEVDGALTAGRTIASHRGGWGRVAVNGAMPGGVVRNIPQNRRSALTFVLFLPERGVTPSEFSETMTP